MWFYLAIFTSVFSAFSVILNKKLLIGVSASLLTWATLAMATPVIAVFALRESLPTVNNLFYLGVTGSVFFYIISKIIGFRAIKIANLSSIYPLISFGPIFTLIAASLPPLNEIPGPISVVGAAITLAGGYLLNAGTVREGVLKPIKSLFKNKASFLMIISIIIESVVVIFDKIAINNTFPKSTTFTLLVENLMVIFSLLPVIYLKNRGFILEIFKNAKLFIPLGILNATMTILAFSAIGGGDVGLVKVVMETHLLFVLLFSYLFFRDRPKLETIVGSLVMLFGIILIKAGV